MTINPRVSVGVLSYNRPQLLRNALESVSRQTVAPSEIIISDNASANPAVGRVLDDFAAERPEARIFRHQINRGAFWNFRFVLEQATGDLFIWLADDDFWSSNFLESLVALHPLEHPALIYPRCFPYELQSGEPGTAIKERPSACRGLINVAQQTLFDSDSMTYGLVDARIAKKFASLLKPWPVPDSWAKRSPTLRVDFVSYVYLYGVLLQCDFINARESSAAHYMINRPEGSAAKPQTRGLIGILTTVLLMGYIHILLTFRFLHAAIIARSISGACFAPFAACYLFIRRLGKAAWNRTRPINQISS